MRILHLLLFFFLGFGEIESLEEMRLCPACIDDKYKKFFPDNLDLFYKNNRSYSYHYGLEKHKCMENSYKKVQCDNSCIRIHLKKVEQNKNKTIGWLFDCSTDVIHRLPSTISGVPANLRKFNGDWKFVDYLNEGYIRAELDVQFYSVSFDVETADQYYRRQHVEKHRKLIEQEQCEKHRFKCLIKKNFKNIQFVWGGLVMMAIFFGAGAMRYYCWSKMQARQNKSTARVLFAKRENDEDNLTLTTDDLENNNYTLDTV